MEGYKEILGRKIRYVKQGKGDPLILLHGIGGSVLQWSENIDALSEDFTVFAFDFPGFGQSWSLKEHETNISFVPLFMEECRKAFGIVDPIIVGGSVGGLFALDYALYFPEKIKKLVLVGSAGLGKEIALAWRLVTLPFIGEFIGKMSSRQGLKRYNWIWKLSSWPVVGAAIEELHQKALDAQDRENETRPSNRNSALRILRYGVNMFGQKQVINRTTELTRLETPTLMIWGENDNIFPLEHGIEAAKLINNATLRIIKNCGHWVPSEAPDEFNETLKAFALS